MIPPPRDRPTTTDGTKRNGGRTTKDSLKPDLVIIMKSKGDKAKTPPTEDSCSCLILDPTVVADNVTLNGLKREEDAKEAKYGSQAPHVQKFCAEKAGLSPEPPNFAWFGARGVAISWRGLMSKDTISELRAWLQMSDRLIQLVIVRALVYGWRIWHANANRRTN